MEEIWKQIGDSFYDVSNFGRVRSNKYLGHDGKTCILSKAIDKKGYERISLYASNGRKKTYKVHRLVAEAFIENPQKKTDVNHKDGNKQNNFIENLEWATKSENVRHAYSHGLKEKTREHASVLGKTKGRVALKRYLEEKHSVRVVLIDSNGERAEYKSEKEAAEAIGSCQPNIHRAIRTGGFVRGYRAERAVM